MVLNLGVEYLEAFENTRPTWFSEELYDEIEPGEVAVGDKLEFRFLRTRRRPISVGRAMESRVRRPIILARSLTE